MPARILKKSWFIKSIFFISAFIILVIGGITYRNIEDLNKSSELLTETYELNFKLEQIFSHLKDAETGQLGFIITNDPAFLKPYESGRENINNSFAELKELTKDNSALQDSLKTLNVLIDKRMDSFLKSFRFSSVGNYNDPNFRENFLYGKNLMDTIRSKITAMIDRENQTLNERQQAYESNLKVTPFFLYLVLLVSLLLMFLAYNKIISDLGKLKTYNEQLEIFKESTKQSEVISQHGNWILDIEENTFTFSDNLYRLLGEEPQSFKPTLENFYGYVHPEDLDKLEKEVHKMIKNENLPFIYYRIIQKNGTIKHFKAYAKLHVNDDGKKQLLGITTDITDEIEHYRILEERNQELERNNKELSAFNYVASHDLQEPLRKIQTFLSRLEDKEYDTLSDSGKRYIGRINIASSRMRLLIDDLLQFSRTNKTDKVFKITDINSLLEAAKQDLAELISEDNAVIKADDFPAINVIPFQIQQLFSNLISNSLKYKSQERTPEIHITYTKIKASEDDKLTKPKKAYYHKITFTDNGIGFDNTYAEKIFVLFNRLHNKDEYSGTGIGLSICKKIVENHEGYIMANGQPHIGATFTIYLPA
ncbi:CHASE3 domain-containing protein [Flavobacteriaceae bacterium XHP0103]|uniref:CHASE3 domain-containing protein n=1 Tax=Marixanthotalea marina TaxID=2844359 RepID=UPI002989E9CE|nr:CHASE3 domain-containing protein [Marixanthotalea marina]MBU3821811.1 CHASE3 domain-containing protein [Marixanthotalea marina]